MPFSFSSFPLFGLSTAAPETPRSVHSPDREHRGFPDEMETAGVEVQEHLAGQHLEIVISSWILIFISESYKHLQEVATVIWLFLGETYRMYLCNEKSRSRHHSENVLRCGEFRCSITPWQGFSDLTPAPCLPQDIMTNCRQVESGWSENQILFEKWESKHKYTCECGCHSEEVFVLWVSLCPPHRETPVLSGSVPYPEGGDRGEEREKERTPVQHSQEKIPPGLAPFKR